MKRKLFIYILLFISLFLLTGCSLKKKALSMDEFQDITIKNNYMFLDVTDQFEYNKSIKKAGLAATSVWQLEFYVFDNKDNAQDMFDNNVKLFKKEKNSTSLQVTNKVFNYENYALTTNKYYMYISRVDNTVVYSRVPVEYRSKIKKFVEKLEY